MPVLSSRQTRPTPAVRVRPFTPVDAPAVLALIERNRPRFHAQGLNQLPLTPADFDDWTRSSRTLNERMLGVFEQDRCVGFVGVLTVRVGSMPVPGLGVWYGLDQVCEGRGLATEGVRQALRWYVQRLDGHAPDLAMVHCRLTNRRSARLAQRLGMQRNAMLDYVRHDGGRSAPRMIGFSMPTAQIWSPVPESENDLNTPTASPSRRRPRP